MPLLNVLSIYQILNYTGFAVNAVLAVLVTSIIPASKPNIIVSGIQQTVAGAAVGFKITGATKKLDLHSFYFACGANTSEGLEGVPQTCTVLVGSCPCYCLVPRKRC